MASELRVNQITSITGVGTVSFDAGGVTFSGSPNLGNAAITSINSGPIAGTRNKIINGNFDIWQRGNSLTGQGANGLVYLADRWAFESWSSTTARVTYDRVLDAPTVSSTVGFSSYSARITVTTTSSNPTNDFGVFRQFIEGYNAQDLYQRPFTVSFWAKSSVVGSHLFSIYGGGVGPGQTSGTPSFSQIYTINSANTWEYKVISVPACPAGNYSNWDFGNGRGMDIVWRLWSNGTTSGTLGVWGTGTYHYASGSYVNLAGTNGATWQISQVQLESGTVASPFERRSYGQELALCYRYYRRYNPTGTTYTALGSGVTASATSISRWGFNLEVPMRIAPVPSFTNCVGWNGAVGGAISAGSNYSSTNFVDIDLTTSGLTATTGLIAKVLMLSNGFIELSTEL